MRVYISASSADISRAEAWTRRCRLAGLDVVSTWTQTVREVGHANPRDADHDARRAWASTDLDEVRSADLLWFLSPPVGHSTRGAWGELCAAHVLWKAIVVSGEDCAQSIFCALGEEFGDDADAFARICAIAASH